MNRGNIVIVIILMIGILLVCGIVKVSNFVYSKDFIYVQAALQGYSREDVDRMREAVDRRLEDPNWR